MKTIKIGRFPGRISNYAVEDSITVNQALGLAGIDVMPEQETKMNGETVNGETVNGDELVENGSTIIVTKRIKGNK